MALAICAASLSVAADADPQFHAVDARRAGVVQGYPIKGAQLSGIQFLLNGWGLAIRDINEDGWPDLVLGGGPGWGGFHLSDGGPWRFTNAVSRLSPTLRRSTIAGIVVSDLDRDGHLDLVASTYDSGILINQGSGRDGFMPEEKIHSPPKGVYWGGMAAADIDQDGLVDIVAAGYRQNRSRMQPGLRSAGGQDRRLVESSPRSSVPFDPDRFRVSSTGLVAEMGAASIVLLNRGGGRMALQALSTIADYGGSGDKALELDWSLSCAFQDIDADGLPDLYVCNDYHSPDRLWINRGGGRFTNGISRHLPYTSLYSMGVAFTDLNRDGIPDWIVTDMLPRNPIQRILEYDDTYLNDRPSELFGPLRQVSRNTLFLSGPQRGRWNEMGCMKGLAASGWSWGPVWIDLDGDGLTDLLVPSGYAQNLQDQGKPRGMGPNDFYPTRENGVFAFIQTPDGRFEERSQALGLGKARSITMAVIPCDMDHDGDPDLVVHNFAEPLQFFENRTDRRHVCLSLEASPGGPPLEGTRVRWKEGTRAAPATWYGGGTYLSSTPPEFHAALEGGASEVRVEVVWADGRSEDHTLRTGWHRIASPRSPRPGTAGSRRPVAPPEAGRLPPPYAMIRELVLPGTTGDRHDDLTMQVYLPVSLDRGGFFHKVVGSTVWLSDPGGGSLVRLEPSEVSATDWKAEIVLKRMHPPAACFLPGRSIGWLENTYRFGSGPLIGLHRLEAGSPVTTLGTVRDNGLARVAGPEAGPWLLAGPARFGRFPEHPGMVAWNPQTGSARTLEGLPFDGRVGDVIWIAPEAGEPGTWLVAEWFGQIWESGNLGATNPWRAIVDPSSSPATGHLQTALFGGSGAGVRGRGEVLVAGLGINNEWVFRADDRLKWLLRSTSNENAFSGLIEFMIDADAVARPLIPLKHFRGDPDGERPANVVDQSRVTGRRIHKDIDEAQGVDVANSIIGRDASGVWQRRRLPLELQVAPIGDAVVIPTPEGPAWLIAFRETDGHRLFGSPPQRWPAVVFWPRAAGGGGGRVVPAAELGFVGLEGDARMIVVTDPARGVRVLAVWEEGRRCRVYDRSGP